MCFCRLIFTLTSNYSACVAEADLKQLQPRLDKISLFIFLLLVVSEDILQQLEADFDSSSELYKCELLLSYILYSNVSQMEVCDCHLFL